MLKQLNALGRKCIYGRKFFEKIFNLMYRISLKGMNYGLGDDYALSGEINCLKLIYEKLKKKTNIVIFDVGANIGNYSKEVITIFMEANYTIHLFEPAKKIFQILQNNLTKADYLIFNNKGIGKKVETLSLYSNDSFSGLSSLTNRNLDHVNINLDTEEKINIITLDNYCNENNINSIDFLKIDIEGHELDALIGAKKLLENKKIQFIQFEMGGGNIDSKTFFKDFYILLNDNYNLFRILRTGLASITKYEERLEVFSTVNYLAVLK